MHGFCALLSSFLPAVGGAPTSATFPLPLPHVGLFLGGVPKQSAVQWRTLRLRRVLHILVSALDYVYEGLRPPQQGLLWREPNTIQKGVYSRLWRFLVACDSRTDRFPLPPGRSGPESLAYLFDLECFSGALTQCGYGSSVASTFPSGGNSLLVDGASGHGHGSFALPRTGGDSPPQLQPYRPLDTSRLKLTGRGAWDAERFSSSLLLSLVAVLMAGATVLMTCQTLTLKSDPKIWSWLDSGRLRASLVFSLKLPRQPRGAECSTLSRTCLGTDR